MLLSLDCGSLLPLSAGQPAGRRVFENDGSSWSLAFGPTERLLRESGDSDGSRAASEKRQQAAAVHVVRLFLNAQEPKFATESTSLFGLVFREAGPVVPSTFEVVATKVA